MIKQALVMVHRFPDWATFKHAVANGRSGGPIRAVVNNGTIELRYGRSMTGEPLAVLLPDGVGALAAARQEIRSTATPTAIVCAWCGSTDVTRRGQFKWSGFEWESSALLDSYDCACCDGTDMSVGVAETVVDGNGFHRPFVERQTDGRWAMAMAGGETWYFQVPPPDGSWGL